MAMAIRRRGRHCAAGQVERIGTADRTRVQAPPALDAILTRSATAKPLAAGERALRDHLLWVGPQARFPSVSGNDKAPCANAWIAARTARPSFHRMWLRLDATDSV